jgi:DNA mismatch endonuclease (patch repair protein)
MYLRRANIPKWDRDVDMADKLTQAERSALMGKVRSTGNRSTEGRVEAALNNAGIEGWEKHPPIEGKPDFFFPIQSVLLFVDGCYWHGCPLHVRYPADNADYWRKKILRNQQRDTHVRRKLRQQGYHVMRVWEHELKNDRWLTRLHKLLVRIRKYQEQQLGDE